MGGFRPIGAIAARVVAEALAVAAARGIDAPTADWLARHLRWALDDPNLRGLLRAAEGAADGIRGAGEPLPALAGLVTEARDWAADASPAERRAYAAAAWEVLSDSERARFLRRAQARAGAA